MTKEIDLEDEVLEFLQHSAVPVGLAGIAEAVGSRGDSGRVREALGELERQQKIGVCRHGILASYLAIMEGPAG